MRRLLRLACLIGACLIGLLPAAPATARDSLGIWNDWGAFRDAAVPRCYAIAMAQPVTGRPRDFQPFFTVGIWPRRNARNEIHIRLSRRIGPSGRAVLSLGGQSFELATGQADAWAQDPRMNAAIVAALRSGREMTVSARGRDGRLFRDTYRLPGAASAMDAAALGCAGR